MSLKGSEHIESVRKYFDENASGFDSRYSREREFFKEFVDRTFRKSMYLRYSWAMSILGDAVVGKTVLDVGCGSGRYCVALAKAGAKRVVGVDISPRMLEVAVAHAKSAGVAECCDFVLGDFLAVDLRERFDFSIAMGFYDYLQQPKANARKLAMLTRQESLMSFPVRWHWLTPQRRLRYLCRGVPLRFYTRRTILETFSGSGLVVSRMQCLGRDYVVCGLSA